MLSSPVIRKSSLLTDKLLHLLSIISVGQSALNSQQQQQQYQQQSAAAAAATAGETSSAAGSSGKETAATSQPATAALPPAYPVIGASHLKLAVEVLTSKSCRYVVLRANLFVFSPIHLLTCVVELLIH